MAPLSAFSPDQTIEEVTATARRILESWGSSSMGSWMANWQSQSDINVALFNHATGYRVVPVRRARAAPTSTEVSVADGPQSQKDPLCHKSLRNGSTIVKNAAIARQMAAALPYNGSDDGSNAAGQLLFFAWQFSFGSWGGNLGEPDGNHNFGAVMGAYGFSRETTGRIAGAAEKFGEKILPKTGGGQSVGSVSGGAPYGDSPAGHAQVNEGWGAGC